MSIKNHPSNLYLNTVTNFPRLKLHDSDSNLLVFRVLSAIAESLHYSKSAHYKRSFIESFYDKELKLALKSGNKVYIKKINKIWSFLLSHKIILEHPCRRSITYSLSTAGLKFFHYLLEVGP